MTTPHEASAMKEVLTGEYTRLSEQLEAILERKPAKWMEYRASSKSAKDADRAWEASADGIEEMKLKMAMERVEKTISSLNSIMRTAEVESRLAR